MIRCRMCWAHKTLPIHGRGRLHHVMDTHEMYLWIHRFTKVPQDCVYWFEDEDGNIFDD